LSEQIKTIEALGELPSKARPAGPWQSMRPAGLPRHFAPRNDDGFDGSFIKLIGYKV
jgi:hypothetical protein